tara:strand:- start:45 stop:200 length:156 start_codon:yes stop_codon:yes gene_type:complete
MKYQISTTKIYKIQKTTERKKIHKKKYTIQQKKKQYYKKYNIYTKYNNILI